ncbi:hypothetical protein BJX68DRAFT_176794 [Aspergillus pseudodeflectus]|uniref:Uncharacterized protein n=1 Tax=Aspergillus pseudodeflectus TaxID=176178 RepID=A0ABR4KYR4_9EURO
MSSAITSVQDSVSVSDTPLEHLRAELPDDMGTQLNCGRRLRTFRSSTRDIRSSRQPWNCRRYLEIDSRFVYSSGLGQPPSFDETISRNRNPGEKSVSESSRLIWQLDSAPIHSICLCFFFFLGWLVDFFVASPTVPMFPTLSLLKVFCSVFEPVALPV